MAIENTCIRDEEKFFLDIKKMALEIKKREDVVIIHHYDADGLTSGAIAIKALERSGKKTKHLCLKQVYKENVDEIKKMGKTYLFVDFGSGQLDYLIDGLGEDNLFILDHHQPSVINGKIPKLAWHINPLLYGIDGGREISGAGVAFFFALALNEKNVDLSPLAIIGALGDMQDFSGKLVGLNRKILDIAQEEKLVSVKNDLRLYGRISRPLISFLMFSSSPIIPGLTANEENCVSFLKQNQIPLRDPFTNAWISYEDLPSEKKQVFSSALITHLVMQEVPEWKIKDLIGEVYTFEKELPKSPLRDCKEAATLGNSCVVGETKLIDNSGRLIEIKNLKNEILFSKNKNDFFNEDLVLKKHELIKNKLIQINTNKKHSLTATPDHKVLVFDEQFHWKQLQNLKIGDFVISPKKINYLDKNIKIKFSSLFKEHEIVRKGNVFRVKNSINFIDDAFIDSEFCEFFGFLLGDGHVASLGTIDLVFGGKNKNKLFKKFKKYLEKICLSQKMNVCDKKTFFNAKLTNKTLKSILYRLGVPLGKKDTKITLDKILPLIDIEGIKYCIKGLFESDAYLSDRIEFSSHSEISYELEVLLKFFGISSIVYKTRCVDCGGYKFRLCIDGVDAKLVYKKIFDKNKKIKIKRSVKTPGLKSLLFELSNFYGFPKGYSSYFGHYRKGKQPSNELLYKYYKYFLNENKNIEKAIFDFFKTNNFKLFLKEAKLSRLKFSKFTGINRDLISEFYYNKGCWVKSIPKLFIGIQKIALKNKILLKKILLLDELINSNFIFEKVIEINIINKKVKVYDLTMSINSNYIANNLVIHNCGRHAMPEVALQVYLGDRNIDSFYGQAILLIEEHKRELRKGIEFVTKNGVGEKNSFYFFDAGSTIQDSLVGIIAGMLYGSVIDENKPIIALARNEDNTIKVSGRGTSTLIKRGLNLGKAFKEIEKNIPGCEGGGHNIAAGMKIPSEKLDGFLKMLDEIITKQLN